MSQHYRKTFDEAMADDYMLKPAPKEPRPFTDKFDEARAARVSELLEEVIELRHRVAKLESEKAALKATVRDLAKGARVRSLG